MTKTVAVIGSTGRVGQLVVQGALDRGYTVRALARDSSKLAALKSNHLVVVKGNVLDENAVKELIDGADVVLSCLGNKSKESEIVARGTKVVVDAIQKQPVHARFVFLSSIGIGDSYDQLLQQGMFGIVGHMFANLLIPLVIGRKVWADIEHGEEIVHKSGVVAVIVRPTSYATSKSRGYVVKSAKDRPASIKIPIEDVAAVFVDLVETTKWDGQTISVFSK